MSGPTALLVLAALSFLLRHIEELSLSNIESSLTLIYQNNLNASDDINHVGAILLDSSTREAGESACRSIHEELLSYSTLQNYSSDFSSSFAYLAYVRKGEPDQSYHIADGILETSATTRMLTLAAGTDEATELPVLCTQSSNDSEPPNSAATDLNTIAIGAADNTYFGYRNKKSFRFLGIRYADPPRRFEYSQAYSGTGEAVNATSYGEQCMQAGGGSEDCLFLNIQTPYIPKVGSRKGLRPVLFWIYGGGFTGGSGTDPLSDGGNLASREDIVVVTINYRLSTLGFLAVPDTDIKGNFGIGDQIVALQWVVSNIASFGGDPDRITIVGASAGAGSVRVLLGSPPAIGLFQGAIAMSNLGGGQTLGLDSNYGTTYSQYYTIDESYTVAGPQIFNRSNCTGSMSEQIACLKQVNATDLVSLATVARYVVQDGTIVNSPQLNVIEANGSSAYVPVMFGVTANDGASFSTLSKTPVNNLTEGIMTGLSIHESYAEAIIASGLFPYYSTGNLTFDAFNVSQRITTDITFRCVDQATVYAGAATGVFPTAYYYQFERTINGFNPEGVSGAPVTPGFPYGNPNLPYFKLHGSDMSWAFGNFFTPFRDANDLYSVQLVSGYFGEFVRSGQPNPDEAYLEARGYEATLQGVRDAGRWEKVGGESPVMFLDYPAKSGVFVDQEQCSWLNYSIDFYLEQR